MDTIVVVTNGNRFARHILGPLLREKRSLVRGVIVVRGDYSGRTGIQSLLSIGRKTTFPYLSAKLLHLAVAEATYFVRRKAERSLAEHDAPPTLTVTHLQDPRVKNAVADWGASLLVSVSCPQRIGGDMLRMFPNGGVNIHSSELPRYAGLAPYYWVLANNEQTTGITVHRLTERFDDGKIVTTASTDIQRGESAYSLFRRLAGLGGPLLIQAVEAVSNNPDAGREQDRSHRSYYSHPDTASYVALRRAGHRVLTIRDLLMASAPKTCQ